MKINPKFVSKYGATDEVLLPPAPEGEEGLAELPTIPVDTKAPVIVDDPEESERFFNIRFNPEDSPHLQEKMKLELNKQKLEEANMSGSPEDKGGDRDTLPRGRKNIENEFPTLASTKHDLLLSACDTYFQLASKK